jgi:curved DNA-binding protein CbpA
MDDAYRALGLAPGASGEEIGRAYRTLVRRYPPELNPERFARIHRAYELLSSLAHVMDEARKTPEATLEALFPAPPVALRPALTAAAAERPPGAALEPLLRPLRRAQLERLLREAFTGPQAQAPTGAPPKPSTSLVGLRRSALPCPGPGNTMKR